MEVFISLKSPKSYPLKIGIYSYSPKKLIGEGSFGKVFEGKNDRSQEKVAIKVICLHDLPRDPYYQQQLANEINTLKSISHEHSLRLYDVISKDQKTYIITEFYYEALRIYSQILDSFQVLVSKNIIHRDLKPANILFQKNDCKLADFGFSRFVDDFNHSLLKSCVGTPLYMAPQILLKQKYGTKCDIWSLGVILYEMVFGRAPWIGFDEKDLLSNILNKKLVFRPMIKISALTQEILTRSLVVNEDVRIGWEELFQMLAMKDFKEGKIEDFGEIIEKKRNILGFLHFVAFELHNNFIHIKKICRMEENLDLDKFQLALSFYVKNMSSNLFNLISSLKKRHKERAQTMTILERLSQVVKRETTFFSSFSKDMINFYEKRHVLENINLDPAMIELSLEISQSERLQIFVINYARIFADKFYQKLGFLTKSRNDFSRNEKGMDLLKCLDYSLDSISVLENEQYDINFLSLHEEKSRFLEQESYFEFLSEKKELVFQTNF